MSDQTKAKKLLILFIQLREILIEEGECNWRRGIELIIDSLNSCHDDASATLSLRYAESTYKSMLGGNGSFSDFYIWRDDFDERVRENEKLESIKNQIWDSF